MTIVLAGAGLAAQRCAQALRRRGHDGPITMLGDEQRLPYDRPPLSKERLAGTYDDGALPLRPRSWYDDHGIELRLGDPAIALDPQRRIVHTRSGERLPYEHLLVATGARPVTLPGTERYGNVHTLRTAADAAALAAHLRPGARLAIAGAGFIGQEVAATARGLGVDVTLIDPAPAPMHRVLGPEIGGWLAGLQRRHGVDVRLSTRIDRFHGRRDTLVAVTLDDGERIACDALLVAIGVRPHTAWLGGAAPDPRVHVAGDAAGGHHWEAAVAQGVAAAHAMLGLAPPPDPRPSFWSDQYGIRIQCAGDPDPDDELHIDGELAARDFAALYVRDGVVRAGVLAGRPRALPLLRAQLDQPLPDRRTV